MPQTKTQKAAAPKADQPEQIAPAGAARTPRQAQTAETERQFEALELIRAFNDMPITHFAELKTFKLILDRDRGCNTPIEDFIDRIVMIYRMRDDNDEGMTLEDVESAVEQLRDADLPGEIEHVHFMAARYPLPKPTPEATEEAASNQ